ncbi:MAG TPA: hypothetical protein VK629_13670 [Steroidobacteraceae bacterium]|nr:hypothetical protein [Steroidobacteraceae bacterium]
MNLQLGVSYRIDQIVPHAGRMSLLDELLHYDSEKIIAVVHVSERSQFFENDRGVPAYVGIEYMAQAVAAFAGIEEVQADRKPKIGLLLGTRRYNSTVDYFTAGARVEVIARMRYRDPTNLVGFGCEILIDDVPVAAADLKAVLPDDARALLDSQM